MHRPPRPRVPGRYLPVGISASVPKRGMCPTLWMIEHKLFITRNDFTKYLQYGLGMHNRTPQSWKFQQLRENVLEKTPNRI